MCYLHPLPMEGPKGKKAKSKKAKTGVEVVQDVLKTPNPQMNEPSYEEMSQACAELAMYTQRSKPVVEQKIVNKTLPTYEEMAQACKDLNDLSMHAQPVMPPQPHNYPLPEPLYYTEEGLGVLADGTEVEWWHTPTEPQKDSLLDYLADEKKPLHSVFLLEANSGGRGTCPVFFGSIEQKQIVLNKLCHEIHPKLQQIWGTMGCACGLVPKLKLSQTQRNPNKVFLACPRVQEARCNFFQWIHKQPKPVKVSKATSPSELKKRVNDMVQESLQKRIKEEQPAGGFQFP